MANKVKFFSGSNTLILEKEVNKWLADFAVDKWMHILDMRICAMPSTYCNLLVLAILYDQDISD